MSYLNWFNTHASKHKKIVDKLVSDNYTKNMIVNYFNFDNMVKKEVDFCPLYKKNKKCHDMDNLNCYLCACPNFRFNDDSTILKNDLRVLSRCSVGNGAEFIGKEVVHHDCSSCQVPHHKEFILSNFNKDWKKVMFRCNTQELDNIKD
ncbi:MAG: hypothetical protein GXO30_08845 [Epsilonproteobacteria bacterium]|nr:hypothetical protein [Campylobacterota bacterium]